MNEAEGVLVGRNDAKYSFYDRFIISKLFSCSMLFFLIIMFCYSNRRFEFAVVLYILIGNNKSLRFIYCFLITFLFIFLWIVSDYRIKKNCEIMMKDIIVLKLVMILVGRFFNFLNRNN